MAATDDLERHRALLLASEETPTSLDNDNAPRQAGIVGPRSRRDPVVIAENLALEIAGRPVLDGVDLRLEPATVFVLLGENGAGKTSLMRTLCGRGRATRGRVRVAGEDPAASPHVRRRIGYVPQSIALYPELTVRENLEAFGAYAGAVAGGLTIGACMEALGLEPVAQRRVGFLSGGYQRRVNLGAALLASPDFLVLDEPTVGLDGEAKTLLLATIQAEARRGAAVLMTTHDLDAAERIAERIGVLAGGRIIAEGEPAALHTAMYATRLIVSFLPATPVGAGPSAELAEAGLSLSEADGSWSAPAQGVDPSVVPLLNRVIADNGGSLRRLVVTRPGLKELYEGLQRKHAGA